jgi:hypothetical protein
MKKEAIVHSSLLLLIVGLICFYIYSEYIEGTTYTKATVVKDMGESCMFGYRWATVVNKNGDSSVVLANERILFNNHLPFETIVKYSERFLEHNGVVMAYIWNKSFWKISCDVTVIKEAESSYVDEVYVIATTKSGIKIKCSINKTLFRSKKIPFSAKMINKVEGCIGYGFVIE